MKPLIILKVGDALPDATARGEDFEGWVTRGFGAVDVPVLIVDPRRGSTPPPPAAVAGAVVTGSQAMVTDRAAWSEALIPWLNALVKQSTPVLGICYGHQLLAHALGGEVGYHPSGMEIGSVKIRKTEAAEGDALFDALPLEFNAQAVHSQSVRRLPPGALHLAGNDYEPHQAYRVGRCAWGVQFHPEFDADAMHGYIRKFTSELIVRGRDPEALAANVQPTAAAGAILQRFARMVEETERKKEKQ